MPTFGELRQAVERIYPGTRVDRRDESINEHLRQILEDRDWRGFQETANLQTTAEYTTGSVAVTQGSTTVTGTGTTFTSAMTGREFRVNGRDEFYTVTYVSATEITLDRNYEGPTDAETGYRIFQRIYSLASDISILENLKRINTALDLDPTSRERLDEIAPARNSHGRPYTYAHHDYDANDRPTVELFPIPTASEAFVYRYTKAWTDLTATTDTYPRWIPQRLIVQKVLADLAPFAGHPEMVDNHLAKADEAMRSLQNKENRNTPGAQMEMADRFTRHRLKRGSGVRRHRFR